MTQKISQSPAGDGKTIIVFSGDLDKVLASFIIATARRHGQAGDLVLHLLGLKC